MARARFPAITARAPSSRLSLLAVHQGGGLGGAPVSLLKLLAALDASTFAPRVVWTEAGALLDVAQGLHVRASVVPTGGAFFYSAHAALAPRTLAAFASTFPAAVRQAEAALRRDRPDLLHLNTSVLVAWAAAARRQAVPVVWTVREVLGPNPWLRRWHAGFIQRHARRIVVISEAVRACLPPCPSIRLVPNAVDLTEFSPYRLGERSVVRAELGIAADEAVIMALGSVQRAKGHWLLLDAFGLLVARRPRTRLVLVCGGVPATYGATRRGQVKRRLHMPLDNLDALLRAASQRGIADRITVTGYVRDVARVLTAADAVVFPSIQAEGFGRPLIEAMAMARPVVATDVGPSASIVGPQAGVLVPPESGALAGALAALLAAPERARDMGRAGRQRVEACFTLERQVTQMQAIYREAALG